MNVQLDREVVRNAKIVAAEQGTTLKSIVETALLAYLIRWPRGISTTRGIASPTEV